VHVIVPFIRGRQLAIISVAAVCSSNSRGALRQAPHRRLALRLHLHALLLPPGRRLLLLLAGAREQHGGSAATIAGSAIGLVVLLLLAFELC
jgi:hypothetical protein